MLLAQAVGPTTAAAAVRTLPRARCLPHPLAKKRPVLTAQTQVTLDLAEPAGQAARIGQCRTTGRQYRCRSGLPCARRPCRLYRCAGCPRMPSSTRIALLVIWCSFVGAFLGCLGVQGIQPLLHKARYPASHTVDLGQRLRARGCRPAAAPPGELDDLPAAVRPGPGRCRTAGQSAGGPARSPAVTRPRDSASSSATTGPNVGDAARRTRSNAISSRSPAAAPRRVSPRTERGKNGQRIGFPHRNRSRVLSPGGHERRDGITDHGDVQRELDGPGGKEVPHQPSHCGPRIARSQREGNRVRDLDSQRTLCPSGREPPSPPACGHPRRPARAAPPPPHAPRSAAPSVIPPATPAHAARPRSPAGRHRCPSRSDPRSAPTGNAPPTQ